MIHGTGDDNVHISHTMALSRELVENDVIFRQQVRNRVVQPHVYSSSGEFLGIHKCYLTLRL